MKNSLRKRFHKLHIKYNLLFIQGYLNPTSHRILFVGIQVQDEFYKLKHEDNQIVLMYDFINPLRKFKNLDDFRSDWFYNDSIIEPIDIEFFDYLMQPISDILKLNPKTYKIQQYMYVKPKKQLT